MKKIFLLLVTSILGVSCISEDTENTKLNLDNLNPFIEKTAPIKDGYTTIIKADDKIIGETNIPITYNLPKGSIETIEYVPMKKDVIYGGWDTYQFTAAFEDTRTGDNDYNDFVCFITRDKVETGTWPNWSAEITMYIQPIAYGAGTVLQFGMTLPDGRDTIFTDNIQRDLFPGTTGYVNTTDITDIYQTSDTNHIIKFKYIQEGRGSATYRFHPFIINPSGEKLYVALNGSYIPTDYLSIVSTTGYPLGIATNGAFLYPLEKTNIINCYSDFNKWIVGEKSSIGYVSNRNNVFYPVEWQISAGGIIRFNPQTLWN